MFNRLGHGIATRPALFVLAWAMAIAAAVAWSMLSPPHPPGEVGSFLPPGSPHIISSDIIKDAFPRVWSNSMIVLVAGRSDGLTTADLFWLDRAARETRDQAAAIVDAAARSGAERGQVTVLSPALPFVRDRLLSRDGRAALALVNMPTNFISEGTIRVVDAAERIIRRDSPAGLSVEITGSAGIGHDYFIATQRAARRTTWVTIIAVLLILILVYQSPIGALVPLVSIGASVYIAFVLLGALSRVGWEVSSMERIFCVVLMFGAGVDYALFWIARYRESLAEGGDLTASALLATQRTGPAILASAGTTLCGLTTMLAADLAPSRNAGKVLAVAIVVALLASLTLAPALARWLGRYLFWPMGAQAHAGPGQRFAWPWLARTIARRPWPVLAAGTATLAGLALWSMSFPPRFDALQELPPETSSARGLRLAEDHFSAGQLYPNSVLAIFPATDRPNDLSAIARRITSTIAARHGVVDVYSLDRPLGKASTETSVPAPLLSLMTHALYQGQTKAGQTVLRFEVLLKDLPFSLKAITSFEAIAAAVRQQAAKMSGPNAPQIMLSGLTSYIINVKMVVVADQRRVMTLATIIITVIVFVMVRNMGLTLFMVLSTWLTYGATITLSNLFFIHVMGLSGLDWKVRLILFVIVVAVGQDYNIFLVSRLLDNDGGLDRREATRRAIIRTGSVISSCGIIMAATLGSLWAGRLSLLRQLGFALALGILIDTFFVRPLLIPSFYLILARRRGAADSRAPQIAGQRHQPDLNGVTRRGKSELPS